MMLAFFAMFSGLLVFFFIKGAHSYNRVVPGLSLLGCHNLSRRNSGVLKNSDFLGTFCDFVVEAMGIPRFKLMCRSALFLLNKFT
jgi:hypothetical protein